MIQKCSLSELFSTSFCVVVVVVCCVVVVVVFFFWGGGGGAGGRFCSLLVGGCNRKIQAMQPYRVVELLSTGALAASESGGQIPIASIC